jgi:phosphohistidine phosphatase
MRLYVVRHAEAAEGSPDELRPLTARGRDQARDLGRRLRDDGVRPDAVLTSPLLRAVETARALQLGEPEADERLAPGATPDTVRAAVRGRGETVLVVGHQPDCGHLVAAFRDGGEPKFPPAGVEVVDVPDVGE